MRTTAPVARLLTGAILLAIWPGLVPAGVAQAPSATAPIHDSSTPGFLTADTTWTVCASGCRYTDPLAAWRDALSVPRYGAQSITIKLGDGTYSVGEQFFTDCACGEYIRIVGNTGNPAKVVLNFDHIAGTNYSGFVVIDGGRIGFVDGLTIQGSGARTARSSWAPQSYGAGVQARGSGSNIKLGPHVIVDSFYYSLLADQGGRVVGNGSTYRNAGDVNVLARFGGVVECLACVMQTASHIFTNAHGDAETLGYNALAEGGSLYIDGSTVSDGEVACAAAQSNGMAWAHQVTGSRCVGYGAKASQNGFIELGHARFSNSGTGARADTGGGMNVDALELDHNAHDGLQLDGGHATGASLSAHDNGGYGVRLSKQGRAELYATQPLLRGNAAGPYSVEQLMGCKAANTPCNQASVLIIN